MYKNKKGIDWLINNFRVYKPRKVVRYEVVKKLCYKYKR